MAAPTLQTERLILRHWKDTDRAAFAELNADPQVMKYFPHCLDRPENNALADRIRDFLEHNPFGLWAVEIPGVTNFAGFIGLSSPSWQAHFTPCIEIGWRLAHSYWGYGYATEGAQAILNYGFTTLALPEIVSFTASINTRSIRVMERLGMTSVSAENFIHPTLPPDSVLQPHVLYRLSRDRYLASLTHYDTQEAK